MRWSLVIPVKRLEVAKTRLAVAPADRADLALAMALDVVAAALACAAVGHVLVVSDDARARAALRELGADLVDDEPDAGLNPALAHGVRTAAGRAPDDAVAICSSDVPTMTADELTAVLSQAAPLPRCFVSDLEGTGTTLLTAHPGLVLEPRYGPASAAAHAAAGHIRLDMPGAGITRDVDTLDDLWAALAAADEGAAGRTRALVARLGLRAG